MQFSAECIILALPFECNFKITWKKKLHPEKSGFLGVKPHWLLFIVHSTASAPAWTETCYCSQSRNRHSLVWRNCVQWD